jgi:CHAD domain-containing protein
MELLFRAGLSTGASSAQTIDSSRLIDHSRRLFTLLLQCLIVADQAGPYGPFQKRLAAFTSQACGIYAGKTESLHQTRVASRRLCELLPVLGLDGEAARTLSRRLKRVTKQLGAVRELDVLLLTIQELRGDDRYSSTALEQLSRAVEEARVAARARLTAKLPSATLQRLARRLRRVAERQASGDNRGHDGSAYRSTQAWMWALEARVTHRARRLRSTIETSGAMYVPERLHAVRIALKKLRYAMEILADTRQKRIGREIALLKTMQDLLGRLHDLQMLIERGCHEQASLPLTGTASGDLGSLVRALEDDCRVLHARYMQRRSQLLALADGVGAQKVDALLVNRAAS